MFTQSANNLFWSKVDKTSNSNGCWIWLGSKVSKSKYGMFYYNSNSRYAHRYSFELANGSIPVGMVICHQCDNPQCVNPAHLFIGTQSDNIQDCLSKGRHKNGQFKGSKNASAKLTEQQVLEIRSLKDTHKNIAKKYGVSKCCIDEIRSRSTWKHI